MFHSNIFVQNSEECLEESLQQDDHSIGCPDFVEPYWRCYCYFRS